jgi:plastocyanin
VRKPSYRQQLSAGAVALLLTACGQGPADDIPAAPAASRAPSATTVAEGSRHQDACPEQVSFQTPVDDRGAEALDDHDVVLEGGDFFFDPTCLLAAEPGSEVSITVRNTGRILHNIEVEEQGVDRDVRPGETVTVTVRVPSSGTLHFVCKYHTSAGMVGALVADAS